MELDAVDKFAAEAFEGFIVRKDLVRKFKGQYPVPTYVAEFLLGRYCASVDDEEIEEGLQIVERQLSQPDGARRRRRTIQGPCAGTGQGQDHRHDQGPAGRRDRLLRGRTAQPAAERRAYRRRTGLTSNERMLTGGFYAEIELTYDAAIAQEQYGRPFGIETLRPIQLSKRDVLETLVPGPEPFSTAEWKRFLLRSVGLEPDAI